MAAAPVARASTAIGVGESGGLAARFEFNEPVSDLLYPSASHAQQAAFKADFSKSAAAVETWFRDNDWFPLGAPPLPPRPATGTFLPRADFQVFVSDAYPLSRSLVPSSLGQRGRMEFPLARVVAGEAAIEHELTHVYFPNGNRMLAEGLAVYVHQQLGLNDAFPNFGEDLHLLVLEIAEGIGPDGLETIHLAKLDTVATPNNLTLRIDGDMIASDEEVTYPVAGSFVRFLIEAHGIESFRALYLKTPLVPLETDAGAPERWREIYGRSLRELEGEWRKVVKASSDGGPEMVPRPHAKR